MSNATDAAGILRQSSAGTAGGGGGDPPTKRDSSSSEASAARFKVAYSPFTAVAEAASKSSSASSEGGPRSDGAQVLPGFPRAPLPAACQCCPDCQLLAVVQRAPAYSHQAWVVQLKHGLVGSARIQHRRLYHIPV